MNEILNCNDIWKYIIIPYVNPKLFRCPELRSVCRRFFHLFPSCPNKSKYIKIPSDKYKTLNDGYKYIIKLLNDDRNTDTIKIPEIWLDYGTHFNPIIVIRVPLVIIGMGIDKTFIKNGLVFNIDEKWNKYIPYINTKLENITINNNYSKYKDGIKYSGENFLHINSCKINKCIGFGIKGMNINIIIVNSIICNIKNCGVHLSYGSIIDIDNLEIHDCGYGISISNINREYPAKIKNINIHHNNVTGISLGGWYPDSNIIISGNNTNISFNNRHKLLSHYGMKSSHSSKIIINGIGKKICHNNYNQDYAVENGGKIVFVS
jgi:hypothetical protein